MNEISEDEITCHCGNTRFYVDEDPYGRLLTCTRPDCCAEFYVTEGEEESDEWVPFEDEQEQEEEYDG